MQGKKAAKAKATPKSTAESGDAQRVQPKKKAGKRGKAAAGLEAEVEGDEGATGYRLGFEFTTIACWGSLMERVEDEKQCRQRTIEGWDARLPPHCLQAEQNKCLHSEKNQRETQLPHSFPLSSFY